MYFETHIVQTDKQGRISLPTGLFRCSAINKGGVLCVFPMQTCWIACDTERIATLLETEFRGSSLDSDIRDSRRTFMLTVKSLHIDLQGRVTLQSMYNDEQTGTFVIVGMGFDFEIWSLKSWQEKVKPLGVDIDEQFSKS